ncbi:A disintegrin and metalloproteinase with thrombospondin motifs adt-1-like [Mytilus californianus]|uniref:A disintegrin and metalloproteinase with thrombospondin motifs adt-1-like n=1 Tax=Mytilus californianus TaxID=6549 RepID=UPI002245734C|nr:A disintegrin and metalloproteinase with thrombospondin motifs adt-1-like [Mytilus californianus]
MRVKTHKTGWKQGKIIYLKFFKHYFYKVDTLSFFISANRTGLSLGNSVKHGNGKIWLDDIECTGTESNMTKCPHSLWGTHNCIHDEDVGVHCFRSYENSYDLSGNWGTWTFWTDCSATCEGGLQSRSRECNNRSPPAYCTGTPKQSRVCNNDCCHSPINGGWSIWTEWTTCTTTCGGGLQRRSRDCNNPLPRDGGTCCEGLSFDNRLCDSACCTDMFDFKYLSYTLCGTCIDNKTSQHFE